MVLYMCVIIVAYDTDSADLTFTMHYPGVDLDCLYSRANAAFLVWGVSCSRVDLMVLCGGTACLVELELILD